MSRNSGVITVIANPLKDLQAEFPQLRSPSALAWAGWLGIGIENLLSWRRQVAVRNEALKRTTSTCRDAGLLRWACSHGGLVAPNVELAAATDIPGTTLIPTVDTPTGMYVASIPRSLILEVPHPTFEPPKEDPVRSFIAETEELMYKILVAAADPDSLHHDYIMYLRHSLEPPRNLPFLAPDELETDEAKELLAVMQQCVSSPLHPRLTGVPSREYRWAMSMALSRRCSGTMLHPLLDKLNHSVTPNSYCTMSSKDGMTGVDVFDNLLAGVPEESLFDPFIHLFTLERVSRGTAFTLSYSDASPKDPSEKDSWIVNWGMVPHAVTTVSAVGLRDLAAMIARRRVVVREQLFPQKSEKS